jgi:thiosulfate dehydrogenase [quinone] large subunit
MAESALVMGVVNIAVSVGQLLIGIVLITGVFVRLAAFFGTIQMTAFYLGGWEGEFLGLFDPTPIYAVVFLAVAAFGAGRLLGVDKYLEQLEVGGDPLIETFPVLRYPRG